MKLVPTLDRLFIVCDEVTTKTAGGVVIPVSGQEETTIGMVVAAGPLCPALVGKRVLFLKNHGVLMKEEGVEIRIMREGETLGYEDEHISQEKNWNELCKNINDPFGTFQEMKKKFVIIKKTNDD